MRGRHFPAGHHAHPRFSLAARGRFWRVFAGQAIFVAAVLLALGAYLLQQEFADPVRAQGAGLLFAAVLIAVAVSLVYCMLCPARKVRHRIIVRRIRRPFWNEPGLAAPEQRTFAWREAAEDSPPSLHYIDRTRIRV